MAVRQSNGRAPAVNPADILNFADAALRVRPQPGIGAIEVAVRSAGRTTRIVLAPEQSFELARRLIGARAAVLEAEGGL